MLKALLAFVAIWSEPAAERREQLLLECWTEDSEIMGQRTTSKEFRKFLQQLHDFREKVLAIDLSSRAASTFMEIGLDSRLPCLTTEANS
jgi:hypothetical protein